MTMEDEKLMSPALLLVKTKKPSLRLELMQELQRLDHIKKCEAVDGDFDIVATIEPMLQVGLERFIAKNVTTLNSIERASFLRVDTIDDRAQPPSASVPGAESLVFLDIDKSRFQPVFQTISLLSATTLCQISGNQEVLILRLRGTDFEFLERVVEEKIRPLQGVLKANPHRIIKLANL